MPNNAMELRCGNCGADVRVTSPATVIVTCDHCGTMSRRSDVDLESIGSVALPAPLASRFMLGTEGTYRGRGFIVRGQVQLNHGAGLWNEWAAEVEGGWIWIAEAQGETLVFEEQELGSDEGVESSRLPVIDPDTGRFDPTTARKKDKRWRAGDWIKVPTPIEVGGRWMIKEIGRGDVVTCRGEFPVGIDVGERTSYVDLVRGDGEVATLDYTRPGTPEFLLGHWVNPAELALDPSTMPADTPERVAAAEIDCPNCGGTLSIVDPERAITLGCEHCGAVLQRETHLDDYAAIGAAKKIRHGSILPIGSTGVVCGQELMVIGFLRRAVREDGRTYPWTETLARTPEGSYRWLVESDGHWSYVEPVQPSSVSSRGGEHMHGGLGFKHFTSGKAFVQRVLGECYWQVEVGEKVTAKDYVEVKAGKMLSLEESPLELSASMGTYVPAEDMAAAFPGVKLPDPSGIGAHQPTGIDPGAAWRTFLLLVLGLCASCVAIRANHANETVLQGQFGPTPATSSEDHVDFTDAFEVSRGGSNLRVEIDVPGLSQGYLDVLGALVNEETGDVVTFTTAAQYYSGRSGGESWSEGDGEGSSTLGRVPAGRYRLRLACRGYDAAVGKTYNVRVRSQVPQVLWFVLALVLLIIAPLVTSMRHISTENQRWSNSDHPWSSD